MLPDSGFFTAIHATDLLLPEKRAERLSFSIGLSCVAGPKLLGRFVQEELDVSFVDF